MADNDDKKQTTKMVIGSDEKSSSGLRTHRATNAANKEDFSSAALKRLSEVRRGQIQDVKTASANQKNGDGNFNTGIVGVSGNHKKKMEMEIKRAMDTTPSLSKIADFGMPSSKGVDRMMPELYSPLFQMANLNLPRDRMTMNAWNRNFFDTHPIVRNAITLHATYPISKINVKCKHRKVEQFFNDMAERIDLFDVIAGVALEFWKHGEKLSGLAYLTMSDGTQKQIKDVKVGDMVITHLGNKKEVKSLFRKPTNVVIEEHLKIYKINVLGLPEPLIISGKHPIFSLSQKSIACSTPSCIKKNMRIWPGTNTCTNCNKKHNNDNVLPSFIETNNVSINDLACASFNTDVVENELFTSEMCYLLGFWAAEGSFLKRNNKYNVKYTGIRVSQNDKVFLQNYIEPLFVKITGQCGHLYTNKSASYFGNLKTEIGDKHNYHYDADIRGGGDMAQFFLKHCGEYSNEKKLSDSIMLLPPKLQLQLLAGFIDGNGCVDQSNGHVIISTNSKNLANQFLILLRRNYIRPTMSKIDGDNKNEDRYRIKIVANEAYDNFYGLLKTEKNNKLRKTKWATQRTIIQNNWHLLPIQSIEDITNSFADEYMYDVEVEDDHSYIANGMAVHNCFPYAELDETNGIWKSIVVQNPDYVTVKKSMASNTPIISLRPDEVMKKMVSSNHPVDIKLRSQIPDNIVHHIRRNEPIPLDNFNISHLKMLSSPYDVRGTSIIVSCYKELMLWDKIRECFSADTEILTDSGFKKYTDVINIENNGTISPNTQYKIASYNIKTDEIQYDYATDVVLRDYEGEMVNFNSKNIDMCVTPGHNMLVYNEESGWHGVKAGDLLGKRLKGYKVKNVATWIGTKVNHFNVLGQNIPAELYLKFLGYLLSEGWITKDKRKTTAGYIGFSQSIESDCYQDMRNTAIEFFKYFDRRPYETIRQPDLALFKTLPTKTWQCTLGHAKLCEYFRNIIGTDEGCSSKFKYIPRFILELEKPQLEIILNALVKGDGSENQRKHCTSIRYNTASSQLASDVQEMAFKCGFYSSLRSYEQLEKTYYEVCWSTSGFGKEPGLYNSRTNKSHLTTSYYNNKVWCVTVPTGAVVIRHNGKVGIQFQCKFVQADSMINPITLISVGGSGEGEFHPTDAHLEAYREIFEQAQWDKDFKVITHAAVKVERIGSNGAIIDTQNDFNFIRENLYAGLMVPKAVMDSEGSAYASASVGLEVLRTRYITFRNMIEKWLEKKIFAPISQLQGFFEYHNGEKVLIVPEIDWNHINLYDLNDYIQALGAYVDKGTISYHTLYRSLGLNFEEEQRLIREEAVRKTILAKEVAELGKMSLVELHALNKDEQIVEAIGEKEVVPGEAAATDTGSLDMADLAPDASTMPSMPLESAPPTSMPGETQTPPVAPAETPPTK